MRIVQTCPYSWDSPGGVQVHVRQLADQLSRRGHHVLVLAPGNRRSSDDRVHIVGAPVRVRYNGSIAPICPSPASAVAVAGALARFRPDVVHVHEPLAPSTSMFAALGSRAPVVATFHAYSDRTRLLTAARPLLRVVWRRLDLRLAVSNAAADFAGGRTGEILHVVPNGADLDLFKPTTPATLPAGRKLLFVNRLEPRKGFAVVVRAFASLAARLPDVMLLAAGDGPERTAVDRLAPAIRSRVIMLGALRHHDLPPYHSAADVFIGPATGRESFGIVLIEAMAAGLPIVASDIPGYREVVRHGIDGLLVPPSDPVRLARAVSDVLHDQSLARRLTDNACVRAREFAWERVVGRLETFYDETAGRPRRCELSCGRQRVGRTVPSIVAPQEWA